MTVADFLGWIVILAPVIVSALFVVSSFRTELCKLRALDAALDKLNYKQKSYIMRAHYYNLWYN